MPGVREIVFDTETTGFDARGADRLTEIGCVEIIDLIPTGETFHTYLNPERDVPEKVTEITGLTREFLEDKPLFADQAQAFLDFIKDSPVIAHNADFDKGFINAELERAGFDPVPNRQFIDTLKIARSKFPGSPASLDALCKRFSISLTSRNKHGALIDAELLAEVYLELRGGRMHTMSFDDKDGAADFEKGVHRAQARQTPLAPLSTEKEREAHAAYIAAQLEAGNPMLWEKYRKRAVGA